MSGSDSLDSNSKRRLVTIMFTDMVGYSALFSRDETLAIEILHEHQKIFEITFSRYSGKIIKGTGDGYLVEFDSAVQAVLCAMEIQSNIKKHNASKNSSQQVMHRVGIHVGEIYLNNGDWHGDSVNIASRLESICENGGICVSQLVAELVSYEPTINLKSRGPKRLKNIQHPVVVHQVVMPWESTADNSMNFFEKVYKVLKFDNYKKTLKKMLLNAPLAILFGLIFYSMNGISNQIGKKTDFIHNVEQRKQIDLRKGWEYATDGDKLEQDSSWAPYNRLDSKKLSEVLVGKYWVRNKFTNKFDYNAPAFGFGYVRGAYKVKINDYFIGMTKKRQPLSYFYFDSRVLHKDKENIVLIEIDAVKEFVPGFTFFKYTYPMIDEGKNIEAIWSMNAIEFNDVRIFYGTAAFVISALCFIFFLFNRERKLALYYSIYLFAASFVTMLNIYPVLVNYVNPKVSHLAPISAMLLSSFILFSSYLHARDKKIYEEINNSLLLVTILGCFAYFMSEFQTMKELTSRLGVIRNISLGYIVLSIMLTGLDLFKILHYHFSNGGLVHINSMKIIFSGIITMMFNILGGLVVFNNSMYSNSKGFAPEFAHVITKYASSYPLIFSGVVILLGAALHFYYSKKVAQGQKTKEFLLETSSIIWGDSNLNEKILKFQKTICQYYNADRVSLFLSEQKNSDSLSLVATHANHDVKNIIQKYTSNNNVGKIIGYVVKTKESLLIRDIKSDHRFSDYITKREKSSYQSDSAMIFPLMVNENFYGVISIADKLDGKSFNESEYAIMKLAVRELSTLISHSATDQEGSAREPVAV